MAMEKPQLIRTSIALAAALCLLSWAIVPAHSQELPPNTVPCEAFKKHPNGSWGAERPVTFDVGNVKGISVGPGVPITPRFMVFDGTDLYVLLERKCGDSRT
jgi:hypothetical protein